MSDTAPPKARKTAARKRKPAVKKTAQASQPPAALAEGAVAVAEATATAPALVALIRVPMPVRWRDLDAFNHVNNSQYLSYLEEARLQWMLSVPGQGLEDHVAPVVAAANLNYRRPIEWPAEVAIELFVERMGNTSLSIGHRIVDARDPGVLYCDGQVVMVWIDRGSGRAAPLPEAVRTACSAF
jgi:acyl-CoA thioester hydrolase